MPAHASNGIPTAPFHTILRFIQRTLFMALSIAAYSGNANALKCEIYVSTNDGPPTCGFWSDLLDCVKNPTACIPPNPPSGPVSPGDGTVGGGGGGGSHDAPTPNDELSCGDLTKKRDALIEQSQKTQEALEKTDEKLQQVKTAAAQLESVMPGEEKNLQVDYLIFNDIQEYFDTTCGDQIRPRPKKKCAERKASLESERAKLNQAITAYQSLVHSRDSLNTARQQLQQAQLKLRSLQRKVLNELGSVATAISNKSCAP